MKVVVVLEHRFQRTPDGRVWTQSPFTHGFWARYLTAFEQVDVVARIQDVPEVSDKFRQANGDAVRFVAVPYYVGPRQFLQKASEVGRAVRGAVTPDDAVILRVSSMLANCLGSHLRRSGHPYGVEVVADPHDVFAPGSLNHPLRSAFRWWFTRQLRRQCYSSCAATYVTEFALQRRYPAGPTAWSTHCSDVELPEAAFVSSARSVTEQQTSCDIVMVGSLDQLYKAPDFLLRAVANGVQQGLDLRVTLVGDGQFQPMLEDLARQLDLGDRATFAGRLPAGEAVRALLDQADLFVLPSHVEGLPRAMIEAMARGLPCIGTSVGGIPELLEATELVPPGDAEALAQKICELATDPQRMSDLSKRNLLQAQRYRNDVLEQRRDAFYGAVRDATSSWIETGRQRAGAVGVVPMDRSKSTTVEEFAT